METKEKSQNNTMWIMKIAYAMFIALSIYHVWMHKNYFDAATNMGIALIFDPFDQTVSWNNRPVWQRIWLLVHLGLTAALFGYGVSID